MTDLSPLRRKIGSRAEPSTPVVTPERLWTRAVTYGLARRFDMPVTAGKVSRRPIMPDACAGLAREGMMFLLIDGPGGYGLALVDPEVTVALTEQQTLGRVGRRPIVVRPPTLADASMMAEPLDQIFRMHEGMVAELPLPHPVTGFRYATRIVEPREFVLNLGDQVHDHWMIEITLGAGGARTGSLQLVLPRENPVPAAVEAAGDAQKSWSRKLEARVLGSEFVVSAELGRVTMPASSVRDLKIGDTLTLPRSTVGAIGLIGANGSKVLVGRLGQSAGRKAIRIEGPRSSDREAFIAAGLDRSN